MHDRVVPKRLRLSAPGEFSMKFRQLRIIMFGTAVAFSPVVLFAQSNPMNPSGSTSSAPLPGQQPATGMQDSNTNANEVSQTMKDKMFLRKAAEGGMAEVQFGQLAAQKAESDDVKAFAQKMVDDHTALNNEMAPIADSLGVRAPKTINKVDQAEYDKLNGLSGSDFDTEYLTAMVKAHHKDLREFRMEAADTQDPTLKAAVDKSATVIREHTMMVDKLARVKGIPMPARGGKMPGSAPPAQ
jgi:putative membrane protein